MKFTEVERMLAERNTFTVKLIDHVDRGRVRTQNTCSQIGANLRRSDWPIFVMQLECGAVLGDAENSSKTSCIKSDVNRAHKY